MIRTVNKAAPFILSILAANAQAGFYLGAGLGPDNLNFKQDAHVFQLGNFDVTEKTHVAGLGIFGTLFAGYEFQQVNPYYLAVEVNGNVSSALYKESNWDRVHSSFASTHYKINNSYGFSALPGYQLFPKTTFYGRLGYTNGHFKSVTSDISLANKSTRLDGFRYGVGVKQKITHQLYTRIDYSAVTYNSTTMHAFDALSSTTKNTKISPLQQLAEFSLIYQFH